MADIKHFISKVAGVTKSNKDRQSRQAILKTCKIGEKLVLERVKDNPADPNEVRVCRANGQQLGCLEPQLAEEFIADAKQGDHYMVFVEEVTGGERGEALGCNLLVVHVPHGVSQKDAQMYLVKEIQPLFVSRNKAAKKSGEMKAAGKSGTMKAAGKSGTMKIAGKSGPVKAAAPKKGGCLSVVLAVAVAIPAIGYLAWSVLQ
jgi:hypothetical protein